MKDVAVADFRNVVLVGHTGAGKTTLLDAVLHRLGVSDRQGSSAAGTSFADWTEEEKDKKISTWAKPFQAAYTATGGKKYGLCFIDTPGYADFVGQMYAATTVADAALIVVDNLSKLIGEGKLGDALFPAFLNTTNAIPFRFMTEYFARGTARKILQDYGDVEQMQLYEPFFREQENFVLRKSYRQISNTRVATVFQGQTSLNPGSYNAI